MLRTPRALKTQAKAPVAGSAVNSEGNGALKTYSSVKAVSGGPAALAGAPASSEIARQHNTRETIATSKHCHSEARSAEESAPSAREQILPLAQDDRTELYRAEIRARSAFP